MSNPKAFTDELASLFDELDEKSIESFNEDQVLELRKKMYPYGRTIEGSDKVLTFCITDLDKRFKQRLLMTSMVGFLNRKLDEYHVPDGIPVTSVYDYVRAQRNGEDLLEPTPDERSRETKKYKKERLENAEWMQKRIIIKEFLEDMFQFNPDEHVRSGYKPNFKDPDRLVIDTPAGDLAINHFCRKDASFKDTVRQWREKQRIEKKRVAKGTEADTSETAEVKADIKADIKAETPDGTPAVETDTSEPVETATTETDASEPVETPTAKDPTVAKTVRQMIPPADIFHSWNYYTEANYDQLLAAVGDLYGEVPFLDFAVNPLSWHENVDKADEFIHKHKNEVITEIFKAHSGKWNFCAPYKQVRDSTRYFNEKTHVLEEMMKQIESDQRMGEELMKNKIRKKKRKNVEEEGADDPAFLKWKKGNTTLKDMGAEEVNQNSYADDDCPDDAVQVDVFRISQGGRKMEKSKFFTKAEAPEMQTEDEHKARPSARQSALEAKKA